MNGVMKFITRENILACISIAAFMMSLITIVITSINNKIKLEIVVYTYRGGEGTNYFLLSILNKSRLAISVSWIYLVMDGSEYPCAIYPIEVKRVRRTKGKEIIEEDIRKSMPLPINIPPLGGVSGYVAFQGCPHTFENFPTLATFRVHSNRGKSKILKAQIMGMASPTEA